MRSDDPAEAGAPPSEMQSRPRGGARWLRWRPLFRLKPGSGYKPAGGWTETVGKVVADLDRLNRQTEQYFLRIGAKLAEFIDAIGFISSQLTALTGLIAGVQELDAPHALRRLLDRLSKIQVRTEQSHGSLGAMRREASRLAHILADFEGMVSTLTTLGVLTQIETARLGSGTAEFGPLADEVRSLSVSVRERVQNALQTVGQLIRPIEGALLGAAALEQRQANDLPSLISGVLARLAALAEMQGRVCHSSARLRAQYDVIADAFQKLIVSIQFHDITRQQVEHVITILRSLSGDSGGPGGSVRRDPGAVAAVLALQISHLADAQDKFAASCNSIARSLEDIACRVPALARESRVLSGFSETENNSFLQQMKEGCNAVLDGLIHCANTEMANEITHRDLAEAIGRMRGAVEKIETVEIQMERLALNAGVRAAHIGRTGNALAVLAGAIQQLAWESAGRSASILQSLDNLSQLSSRLSVRCVSAKSAHCKDSMRAAVEELHSSNEHSFALIAQIHARGENLHEDLCATRGGFTVGAIFAEAVNRAREALGNIVETARSEGSTREAGRPDLTDFTRHYTMQAERDVHESAARPAIETIRVVRPKLPVFPAEAENPAQNVEFF